MSASHLLTIVIILLFSLTGTVSAAGVCYGLDQTNPAVCGGRGLCKSNNACTCLDMSPANALISQTGGYNGILTSLNTSNTLTSSNGQYQASLNSLTGQLEIFDLSNSTMVYQSGVLTSLALFPPFELRLSTECQITIYGNNILGLTLTGTVSPIKPCRMVLRNNGELVMYSSAGYVWWTSNSWLSSATDTTIYQGSTCQSPLCYGIVGENSNVCSGKGNCTFTDTCACHSGYLGNACDSFKCFGNLANDTLNVCSGNGNCLSPDICSCNSGFYGPACNLIKCFNVLNNETSKVCSGHGICSTTDNCTCELGYLGSNCEQFQCFGIANNITTGLQLPCSGNGTCIGIDQCSCQSGFIGNECETFKCFNIFKNDTLNVCSGNGSCISPNQCLCQSGFFGSKCEAFKCQNKLFNDSLVCSGNGLCNAPDQCICKSGYSGSICDQFTCFGISNNLTSGINPVCSGNGSCTSLDQCICNSGYLGDKCETFSCFNKLKNDSLACSGKGSCILPDTCSCSLGYEGLNCQSFKCFGKMSNDSSVCNGNGLCSDLNQCNCKNNWLGLDCSITTCFDLLSNDTNVCSKKGNCVGLNQCQCQNGYFGSLCDVKRCFSYLSNETSLVCNGQGTCTDLDTCSCNSGFLSSNCSVNTNPFSITLNVSSLSLYQTTAWNSVKILVSEITSVNLLNFNWYCLDCVVKTSSSNLQKGLVSTSQILQFRTSDLVAGTYNFIANSTFSNISPYPNRVSNSISFKLTVLDINTPTLDIFGLPSVIISKIDQPISSVISSMTLNQSLAQSFIGKCSNVTCSSTQVTYSWTISSIDNTFKVTGDGITNVLNLVDSTLTLSPPIQLTTNLLALLNSTLTFSLKIFNPLLKSLTSLIQIPIVSPPSPPVVNIPGYSGDVYGANTSISNVMKVTPSQGISLTNLFTITIESWSADSRLFPLRYAVGFYDKKTGLPIRVTEYSNQTEISIYLPYMKSTSSKRSISAELESVELIVFIMDILGNVELRKSATVFLSPFSGTASQLTDKINSLTGYSLTVASYDQSYLLLGSSLIDLTLSLVKNITIDPKSPTAALTSLQSLTADVNSLTREIIIEVNGKLNGFLTSVNGTYADDKKNYGFVKSKLANSDVTLTVSVSSNLLQSALESESTKNVVNQLVYTILFGEIPSTIQTNQKTLTSVSYSSNLIDFAVSSFQLSNQKMNQTQSIIMGNYSSVAMNISNILSQYNGFSKDCGVSLIIYSKNTNFDNSTSKLKVVSSVNDFKFSIASSVVPLSDLSEPIVLKFELVDELTTILESLKNETLNVTQNDPNQLLTSNEQKYLCKYWDESSQLWSSKGCTFKSVNLQSKTIECSCIHTTMFTTFIEQNSTFVSTLKDQVSALYSVQIALGIVYASVATVILIGLIAFRKEQPVSSRLMTPYFGMVALIAESFLIYIIQRSILADQLLNSSPSVWETGDNTANIIANVVAIVVNTLNLTAILSYVIQVSRFQLMKYLYQILSTSRGNEQKSEKTINTIRFLTAPSLSNSVLSAFAGVNVIYWLLWVILRRTNAIEPATYTYIVSISYTVCILTFSVLIALVAILDFIGSTKKHVDMNNKRRTAMDHLVENPSSSFKKEKKKFVGNPFQIFRDWLITLDGPLYFRMEMILYIVCFIFLILNQGIGLSSLPYRYDSVDSFRKALLIDGISFIFEVLYVVSYIFVFGGFALIITLKYKYQKWKYQKALKAAATEPQNEEIWIDEAVDEILQSQEGTTLFETFCVKEFSCENLYLYQDLQANKEIVNGQNFKDLPRFMSFVFHNYVKVGAPSEVNLPSMSRNSFLFLFRSALSQKETFSSSQQIKLDSKLLSDYEAVEKEIHTDNIPIIELTPDNIKDCFENLDRNVLINIGDTFSRFVYTPEYKIFKKAKELQNAMIQKANIVYGL